MDDNVLENELYQLVKDIGGVPGSQRDKLLTLTKQTASYHKQLKKNVNSLHELLGYLKVVVKYLVFDLEATRRENTHLRGLIEKEGK